MNVDVQITQVPVRVLRPEPDTVQVTVGQKIVVSQAFVGIPGASGATEILKANFSYGDASPATLFTLAANSLIVEASISIRVAFNGANPSLALGVTGDLESLVSASMVDATTAVQYGAYPDREYSAGTQIKLSITPGFGASQGSGVVVVKLAQV